MIAFWLVSSGDWAGGSPPVPTDSSTRALRQRHHARCARWSLALQLPSGSAGASTHAGSRSAASRARASATACKGAPSTSGLRRDQVLDQVAFLHELLGRLLDPVLRLVVVLN